MNKSIREPVNSLTHLGGALLSLVGLILLLFKSIGLKSDVNIIIGAAIFGLSLIALYTTSGVYHLVKAGKDIILRLKKLDHSMIYVLIAGSYTPILMRVVSGTTQIFMLTLIWTMALGGVFFRVFWIGAPRWLYTVTYLVMGWISVFLIGHVLSYSGPFGLSLLVAGGLSYTIGGVIYGLKKPNISKLFGFHELFHCFVLLGSLLHFIFIYFYML